MRTDAAFRTAFAAAPHDPRLRLAYAAWLDEFDRRDIAAALRQDVALAAARPWDDRYWELRRERPGFDRSWPADLGRLADRAPLLCDAPDDWRCGWRAVRAFVGRWWGVPLGDVGNWQPADDRWELPPGVREWAAFSGEFRRHPAGRGVLPTDSMVELHHPGSHHGFPAAAHGSPAAALCDLLGRRAVGHGLDGVRTRHLPRLLSTLSNHFATAGRFAGLDVFETPGAAAVLRRPTRPGLGDGTLRVLAHTEADGRAVFSAVAGNLAA